MVYMHREIRSSEEFASCSKGDCCESVYLHTIHVGINDGIICPGHEVRIGQ